MSKVITTLRVTEDELAEIDRRASDYRMARTEYMIRAATHDLPSTVSVDERIARIDERIERLEASLFAA
jgi:uncharacterized protein (DUF1778 family)